MVDPIVQYALIVCVLLANAAGVILVAFQLPGTWLIVGVMGLLFFLGKGLVGWQTFGLIVILSLLGEIIEAFAGAIGAKKAGGSRWGVVGAILGGIIGALVGTFMVPILLVGTLLGTALGAGVGSVIGDKFSGQSWDRAIQAGKGAALGKLVGAFGKVVIAILIWVIAAAALFT